MVEQYSYKDYPKPPNEFQVITGAEELRAANAIIDNFFGEVLNFIGYDERAIGAFTKTEKRLLIPGDFTSVGLLRNEDLKGIQPEDFFKILIARNYVVATGLFRRDDFNYWQIATAHYLNPEMITDLRKGIVEI